MSTQSIGSKRSFENFETNYVEDSSLDKLIAKAARKIRNSVVDSQVDNNLLIFIESINKNTDFEYCLKILSNYRGCASIDEIIRGFFTKTASIVDKEKFLYAIPKGRRVVVYEDFIGAAVRDNAYEKAEKAYRQAEKRGCLTDGARANFAGFTYRQGKKEMKEILEEAKAKNYFNSNFYVSLLESAYGAKKYNDVKTVFDEAVIQNCLNEKGCLAFIKAAREAKKYEDAKTAFLISEQKGLCTGNVIAQFIWTVDDEGDYEMAKEAVRKAVTKGLLNEAVSYNFITAAYRKGEYENAREIFNKALDVKSVNQELTELFHRVAEKQIEERVKAQGLVPRCVRSAATPPDPSK